MDSIVVYKDYGKIVFDIRNIMNEKGITVSQIVKKTGLHHRVIKRYCDGNVVRYDAEVLSKLCFVLGCELQDIMYYKRPN